MSVFSSEVTTDAPLHGRNCRVVKFDTHTPSHQCCKLLTMGLHAPEFKPTSRAERFSASSTSDTSGGQHYLGFWPPGVQRGSGRIIRRCARCMLFQRQRTVQTCHRHRFIGAKEDVKCQSVRNSHGCFLNGYGMYTRHSVTVQYAYLFFR